MEYAVRQSKSSGSLNFFLFIFNISDVIKQILSCDRLNFVRLFNLFIRWEWIL